MKHRNIVKIHDFGQIDGTHYFTMELAERGSLSRNLKDFAGNVRASVALMEKIARAIDYVHESNILHRDLKPGNILLEPGDEPIVSDFGLAKQLAPTDVALTATGAAPGTPAYMAPEQVTGSAAVSRATDIWALGVILYELVCGQRPFTGPTKDKVTEAIMRRDPPDPRSLQPKVDRALEAVILKCLRKDHNERYKTAAELADDLARWQRGEPTAARPMSLPMRFVRRHRRLLASALGLTLLVALAGAAAYLVPDRTSRDENKDENADLVLRRDIMPYIESRKRTVLVKETGRPAWSRLIAGTEVKPKDGPLTLEARKGGILELLPVVPLDSYELRAEVLHNPMTGKAGIYCCRSAHQISWGELQGFCTVTFSDWGPNRGKAILELRHQAPPHPGWPNGYFGWQSHPPNNTFDPAEQKGKPPAEKDLLWRTISIRVAPERIRWYWEGTLVGTLEKADRLQIARTLTLPRGGLEGARPDFAGNGGLGVFVFEGSASFRNMIIEPLTE